MAFNLGWTPDACSFNLRKSCWKCFQFYIKSSQCTVNVYWAQYCIKVLHFSFNAIKLWTPCDTYTISINVDMNCGQNFFFEGVTIVSLRNAMHFRVGWNFVNLKQLNFHSTLLKLIKSQFSKFSNIYYQILNSKHLEVSTSFIDSNALYLLGELNCDL